MQKGLVVILYVLCFNCIAEAKRLHFFGGYSSVLRTLQSERTSHFYRTPAFVEEIIGGIGLSTNLMPALAVEWSIFFPGVLHKNFQHEPSHFFLSNVRTGVMDLMLKVKLLSLTENSIFYVKGGGWILSSLKKSCFLYRPERTPIVSETFGYGWALGFGIASVTFPFQSCPLNISATYFQPKTLSPTVLNHLPACFQRNGIHHGFISIKIGFMWPN